MSMAGDLWFVTEFRTELLNPFSFKGKIMIK